MGEARRRRLAQAAATVAPAATIPPEVAAAARRMVAHLADERPRIGPLLNLCLSEPAAVRVLGRLALCRPKVVVDPDNNVTIFPGSLSPGAGRLARRLYAKGVANAEETAEAVLAELR